MAGRQDNTIVFRSAGLALVPCWCRGTTRSLVAGQLDLQLGKWRAGKQAATRTLRAEVPRGRLLFNDGGA